MCQFTRQVIPKYMTFFRFNRQNPIFSFINKFHSAIGRLWLAGITIAFAAVSLNMYGEAWKGSKEWGYNLMLFVLPPLLILAAAFSPKASWTAKNIAFFALLNVSIFFAMPFFGHSEGSAWGMVYAYGAIWLWGIVVFIVIMTSRSNVPTNDKGDEH